MAADPVLADHSTLGSCQTMPQLLVENAERYDRRTALRWKRFGLWEQISWADYRDHVRDLALGLTELGLEAGHRVAIVGDNRPEWAYAALAVQAMKGWSVGLYQDSLGEEFRHIINHAEPEIAILQDQEQVDKLLGLGDGVPSVKHIVYYDSKGLHSYDDPRLVSMEEVKERGRLQGLEGAERFARTVASADGKDVAGIFYTSGTTGAPKGTMLTYGNLMSMATGLNDVDPLKPGDDFLSFLPMGWIGEQMMTMATALLVPLVVNFPEEPETVSNDLREIGPRAMFAPPRVWENNLSTYQVGVEEAPWLKRVTAHWAMRIAHRALARRTAGKQVPPMLWLARLLAEHTMLRSVKNSMGLTRLRRAYTGGAAMGPEVFDFFQALGVNLKQVYGQTECAGIAVVHRDGRARSDTVGEPLPGVDVTIADSGEIFIGGDFVFAGYYRDPEATAAALTPQRQLRTGDAGFIDPANQLTVIDRVKDLMCLADETQFSPQFLENRLKFSQYIRDVVIFGRERDFVSALISIDAANVGHWAERNHVGYTTYTDLTQKPEVVSLILSEVRRVNVDVPDRTRIHRFVLLHKELDADDDELTRTRKIRRGFVEERYRDLIDALYGGEDRCELRTEVRYSGEEVAESTVRLQLLTAIDIDATPPMCGRA
ncbi:hypothetical protein ASD30_00200 [Nocardioides sp. Root140]|nr:hypothetical protein ASD30_00200 [Nocardioides sp. Root140]KRF17608.1 hypothetical protein ASH02_25230 [Nocardioides sp. Soil796]